MIKKINHIGLVVQKIDPLLSVLKAAFGAREILRAEIPVQNQISCIVQLGDGYLELMEPTSSQGAAGKFLSQKGEGLHHISLVCNDVDAMAAKLEKEGVRVIRGDLGARGKIAFVHPKSLSGLLLEITNLDSSQESPSS